MGPWGADTDTDTDADADADAGLGPLPPAYLAVSPQPLPDAVGLRVGLGGPHLEAEVADGVAAEEPHGGGATRRGDAAARPEGWGGAGRSAERSAVAMLRRRRRAEMTSRRATMK